MALLPEHEYGFVNAQFIRSIAASSSSPPTSAPADGFVRFVSVERNNHTETTFATHEGHDVRLDSEGWLTDGSGQGVWLIVGRYYVSFAEVKGANMEPFYIDVTTEHTEATPLWLPSWAPYVPDPTTVFVVNEQVYTETLAARDQTLAALASTESTIDSTVQEYLAANPPQVDGEAILAPHINSSTPHPAYDDLPSLILTFENGLI